MSDSLFYKKTGTGFAIFVYGMMLFGVPKRVAYQWSKPSRDVMP